MDFFAFYFKMKSSGFGAFGFKIGRKLRLMRIDYDNDLLWQILVREIYVLMKHYKSIENLQPQFLSLKETKALPKKETVLKCEPFTDLTIDTHSTSSWNCLLRFCQLSYINVLESGYFMNNGKDCDQYFILDFNTSEAILYIKTSDGKIKEHEKATINEIMEFLKTKDNS